VPLADHADRAVAAALAVQQGVRAEFGESLHIGIGVNTGRVIAGTVGGEGKLEFTVIGDPVNVAARVEQLTKVTGDSILITAATRDALTRVPESIIERGEFDVRGKSRGVWLYSVG
jgi:class 3 adenylate cyclase